MTDRKLEIADNSKRAQILKTAQTLFVEQGYDRLSMDALAQAVPVSKRTLYNHFVDKKTLFTAVMQDRCNFVAENIEHILMRDETDIERTLTRVAEHFLEVVLDPHAINIYRTVIAQFAHFPELGAMFYGSGPMRSKKIFADYLQQMHARKRLVVADPHHAADVFFGMLAGRMQMRLLLGVEKCIKSKEIKVHIAYVVDLFLRGQSYGGLRTA